MIWAARTFSKITGSITGNKFTVGERAYRLVVLPPGLNNLDAPTVGLIEKYLKGGGRILSFVDAPGFIDGAESKKILSSCLTVPGAMDRSTVFKRHRCQRIVFFGRFSCGKSRTNSRNYVSPPPYSTGR